MSIALHYSFRPIDNSSPCSKENITEDQVEQVYLKLCDLLEAPSWLMQMTNLTHLNLSGNRIQGLPLNLNLLTNLNYLDVSENQISFFPETFFELQNLCYFDASGNLIKFIPQAIKNLKCLMYFGFARNPITQVPLALTECTEITDMSFEACTQLSIIPKNLLAMRKLRNISLKNCNLAHLPSVISQHLNSLIITGNRLMKWIPFDALPFLSFDTDFLDILEDEQNCSSFTNIPLDIEKLHQPHEKTAISLKEASLRASREHGDALEELPLELFDALAFPTAVCSCGAQVFSEAFAAFLYDERFTRVRLPFMKMFCSGKCLTLFTELRSNDLSFAN